MILNVAGPYAIWRTLPPQEKGWEWACREPKSEAQQTPYTCEKVPQMHKVRNLSNSHLIPQNLKIKS
ncbi:hypothetical protein SLEP1_g13312 [Rubroshorea leprosula]|uniref:Uncharacterized protein n=1 Tax=Rubroshorea leprosula TaxID=152421 RepID=A0AAV5IL45_9ROSI|nr:hypothetical protein SLEP1_g13312 [Rubroshorea leprosula]